MRDELPRPAFVEVGESRALGVAEAVAETVAQLDPARLRFAIAFVPAHLDAGEVAAAFARAMEGIPVVGCTTAGQITGRGYDDATLLVLGFPRHMFRCASLLLEGLHPDRTMAFADAAQKHNLKFRRTAGWNRLALLFADGLSKQEDLLVSTLDAALDGVPVFGGSAGDALRFESTSVLHEGKAHSGAAVLLLIETALTFEGLCFDHFLPVGAQVIITGADPDERLVYEINGTPAAVEYARLVGCPVEGLCPEVFAEHPMLLRHNQAHYARAISGIKDDHALSFLAAIDDGLILTLGEARGGLAALRAGLDVGSAGGRSPDFILGFDCFLRRLAFEQKEMQGPVSDILRSNRVFGFNTYGEQRFGVHMNHTFVGVAFFETENGELR